MSRDAFPRKDTSAVSLGDSLVEMRGIRISYGDKTILGNWQQDVNGTQKDGFWWDVKQGQRWGVFGPNGIRQS
jgi:ABC-type molybdenum transport system ATPase subunit/photorepair protein PhrA